MSVKMLKRIFSVFLVASAAVVFGANPFRTYRNSNTDSQDLGMQIISKAVTPFSFEISLGGTQLTASSVKAELLNKVRKYLSISIFFPRFFTYSLAKRVD